MAVFLLVDPPPLGAGNVINQSATVWRQKNEKQIAVKEATEAAADAAHAQQSIKSAAKLCRGGWQEQTTVKCPACPVGKTADWNNFSYTNAKCNKKQHKTISKERKMEAVFFALPPDNKQCTKYCAIANKQRRKIVAILLHWHLQQLLQHSRCKSIIEQLC